MGNKRAFIQYIHNFRGIAIIYVVAAHILVAWEPDSMTKKWFEVIWQNSTILFLFIAGYLFQHLSDKFEYKDYLIKKFQNVILPYFILSAPVIFYRLYFNDIPGFAIDDNPTFASWTDTEKLIYYIRTGAHLQPLWFIPMITLYYIISPILLYIDRNPRWYWVLVPLFAISYIIPRSVLSDTLNMGIHFISVYLFGMFLSKYKDEYLELAKKYWIPLTILAFSTLIATYFANDFWYDRLDFTHKVIFCCFYIYWLWRLEKYIPNFIGVLATYSFGIFFVHYFWVLFVRGIALKLWGQEVPGNLVYWTISFLVVLIGSVACLKVAQLVLKRNSKYVVGI
jgi:peptidoglycan/LPS O-acetylase OafA/YrhL